MNNSGGSWQLCKRCPRAVPSSEQEDARKQQCEGRGLGDWNGTNDDGPAGSEFQVANDAVDADDDVLKNGGWVRNAILRVAERKRSRNVDRNLKDDAVSRDERDRRRGQAERGEQVDVAGG